ncbi:MAG: tetratricopeptide repeat protein, partial [candidate division NC10 bacterium]
MTRRIRRLGVVGGLLVAAIVLAACQGSPEVQKGGYLQSGLQYLKDRRYDEAIIEFRNALQIDPRFADAHAAIGEGYQGKGWVYDARWAYTKAIEIDPQHLQAHLDLARLYREVGLIEDAIRTVRKAIEIDGENATAYIVLGRVLTRKRAFTEAKQAIDTGLRLDPEALGGYLAVGEWHLLQHHNQEARASFEKALGSDQRSVEAYVGLASLAMDAGDLDEAAKALRAAIAIHPTSVVTRVNLARLYASQDRIKDAIAQLEALPRTRIPDLRVALPLAALYNRDGQFEKTITLLTPTMKVYSKTGDIHYLLGKAYLALKKIKPALGAFREVVSQHPDSPLAQFHLGQALARAGLFRQAASHLEVARDLAQGSAAVRLELANVYLKIGRPGAALEEAKAASTMNPEEPLSYSLMGLSAMAMRNYSTALEHFSKELSLAPQSLQAYVRIGRVYDVQGKPDEALKAYRTAIAKDASRVRSHIALIQSHISHRRWQEAIQAAREALEAAPGRPEILTLLGAAYMGAGQRADARP